MPPRRLRLPRTEVIERAAAEEHRDDSTDVVRNTTTVGPGAWHVEAEAHLREAGRALEVLGLVDNESARLALIVYRLASRVRADRTGVHP